MSPVEVITSVQRRKTVDRRAEACHGGRSRTPRDEHLIGGKEV